MTRMLTVEESFRLNLLASTDRSSALKFIADVMRKDERKRSPRAICVEYQGEPMSLLELSQRTGIAHRTILRRYHRGDRGEVLVRAPDPMRTRKAKRA